MASETRIVHINGSVSEIETNANNKITYKLSDPIVLQEGDIVSLYQSFINVRGIGEGTIIFNEDQEIIMRFYYYVPANLRIGIQVTDTLVHENEFTYQEFQSYPATPYEWHNGHGIIQADFRFELYDERILGNNNTPCILCDVMEPSNPLLLPEGTIIPRIGQKSIYIPKGTYTVDTLTKLFSDQANGIKTQAQNINTPYNDFENDRALEDTWFMSKYLDKNASDSVLQMDGFTTSVNIYVDNFPLIPATLATTPPTISPAAKQAVQDFFTTDQLTGERKRGSIFLTGKSWNYVQEQWKIGILTTVGDLVQLTENTRWATGPVTDYLPFFYRIRVDPKEAANNENTHDNEIVRYELAGIVGASEFILQYSGDVSNRFAFSNLHTPLKQPSHLSQSTVNPLSGNQMTTVTTNILELIQGNPEYAGTNGFYPCDCTSGIAVISFNFKDVINNSNTYQTIQNTIINQLWDTPEAIQDQYKWFFLRHDEWFTPLIDSDPAKLWLSSFWYRLGFSYQQIGNITPNLNKFSAYLSQKNQWTMPGFITKNQYDLSQATSSSGLGLGIDCGNGEVFQNYGTVGIFIPCWNNSGGEGVTPTSLQRVYYNLEATSKFYNALSFPDLLGGKNYIIIHSNLIPNNYNSASYDGGSIIGLSSFEFSQLDTLFGQDEIVFSIQQERVLHQIFIRLTWPDGTDIENEIIGAESGFIIKILRPMVLPSQTQNLLLNQKDKNQKDKK